MFNGILKLFTAIAVICAAAWLMAFQFGWRYKHPFVDHFNIIPAVFDANDSYVMFLMIGGIVLCTLATPFLLFFNARHFSISQSMTPKENEKKKAITQHVQLDRSGYGSLLTCPACGFDRTHHSDVQVFECDEDAVGLLVRVNAGVATVDTGMICNPSARRHGLTMSVDCEGCDAVSLLSIEKHKGQTFLRWLKVGLQHEQQPSH